MTKSPAMTEFTDELALKLFGRKMTDAKGEQVCVCCHVEAKQFRDTLSANEYTLSGLCQTCQDEVFGGPDGEDKD